MGNNPLSSVEYEDIVFQKEDRFVTDEISKYEDVFGDYVRRGKIKGNFYDETWMANSDVKGFGFNFQCNDVAVAKHLGSELGITPSEFKLMLRGFATYNFGSFIFHTIREWIREIKAFGENYGEPDYRIKRECRPAIQAFLEFIGVSQDHAERIMRSTRVTAVTQKNMRELSPLINYLVLDAELSDLYSGPISDAEFVQWFPVLFWTKITFILPLRATECLLTPFDCIKERNGETWLTVRRTILKKGGKDVFYDVDKDYRMFDYRWPSDSPILKAIDHYKELTKGHKRRFLMDYSDLMINGNLSLQAFNLLIATFIQQYIVGNWKYDYAKFASGITEFEMVTAGDSRPIAMANLYYQNAGADICRQLANHENINTSAGYYTNVSNTVLASSIMQLQRNINNGRDSISFAKEKELPEKPLGCLSPRRPKITGDINDCILEDHLHECLGCRYYDPSKEELDDEFQRRKTALDEASRNVITCMAAGPDKDGIDFDKVFLDAYTAINRLRTASEIEAKEKKKEWQRYRSSQTIS